MTRNLFFTMMVLLPGLSCTKEDNPFPVDQLFFQCADDATLMSASPSEYQGLPQACLARVLADDFSRSNEVWLTGNDFDLNMRITGGVYKVTSNRTGSFYLKHRQQSDLQDNFQMEARIRLTEANPSHNAGLFFGGVGVDGVYHFSIHGDGRFRIGHVLNSSAVSDLLPLTPVPGWRAQDFHLLTIRSFRGDLHFFVDGIPVGQLPGLQPYGAERGLRIGPGASLEMDDFVLSRILF
jgi:hypothetical protein